MKTDFNDYMVGQTARGIFRIYNLKTDESYLGKTEDLEKTRAKERFMLDLGMHPCKALQHDYTTTGLELFVIEMEKSAQREDDLEALYQETVSKLTERGIKLYPL